MKKIILLTTMIFISLVTFSEDKNSYPSELDTIIALDKELKNIEASYRMTQIFQFISIAGFSSGAVLSSVSESLNSLQTIEPKTIEKMRISSATILSTSTVLALITTIINNTQYKKILEQREVLNNYLLDSEYEKKE